MNCLLVMLMVLCCSGANGQPSKAEAESVFPVGDIQLTRDQLTSSTFSITLDNLNPYLSIQERRAGTQSYLIAGAKDQPPQVRMLEARYGRYYNGTKIEVLNDIPPASDTNETTLPVVRVSETGIFRNLAVYTMVVTVSQSDSAGTGDSFYILDRLKFEIDLGTQLISSLPVTDPESEWFRRELEFSRHFVLNADIHPAYWVKHSPPADAPAKWIKLINDSARNGPVFRIPIHRPGLYHLAPTALTQTGSSKIDLPASSNWRLYHKGSEVPLVRFNNNPDPYLIIGSDNFSKPNEEIYWLATQGAASTNSNPPLRLQASTAEATGTLVKLGRFEVVAEGFTDYHAKLRNTPQLSRWYWKGLTNNDAQSFPVNMPEWFAPDASATTTLHIHFGLSGYASALPNLRIYANGVEESLTSMTTQQGTLSIPVDSGSLRPGENILGLRVEYPAERTPQDLLVQKLRTTWEQPLSTQTIGLPFAVPGTIGAGPIQFEVTNDTNGESPPPYLVSYMPDKPVLHTPSAGENPLLFAGANGAAQYQLLSPDLAYSIPPETTQVENLPPLPDYSANYVIVADSTLTTAVRPLIAHRLSSGLIPFYTTVEDVLNQFNYGNRDGEAIRNMMLHIWSQDGIHKPQYLLLVGEASDFRGHLSLLPPGAQRDMVPTIGTTASDGMHGDHGYGQLFGDDHLQDISVGRLSVRNASELQGAINKIFAYEEAPAGDWVRYSDFVLDDNEEFPTVVDNVVTRGSSPPAKVRILAQSRFGYNFNMRVPGRKRSRVATDRIIDQINSGASTLSYFGHGGPNLWSHERLLHLQDMPLLKNTPRLPLITCASCDNAWIDYPTQPVNVSMGELLVKKPDGGGIGVFGPVAGASPYEHSTLVRRLMEGIYRKGILTQGMATLYSKNLYFTDSKSAAVPEQYLLIGDPAVTLKTAEFRNLTVSPSTISTDEPFSVRVTNAPKLPGYPHISLRPARTPDEVTSAPFTGRPLVVPPVPPDSYVVELSTPEKPVTAAARIQAESDSSSYTAPQIVPVKASDGVFQNVTITPALPLGITGEVTSSEAPTFRFLLTNGTDGPLTGTAQLMEGDVPFSLRVPFSEVQPNAVSRFNISGERALDPGPTTLGLSLQAGEDTANYEISFHVVQPANLEFVEGSTRVWGANRPFIQRETVFLGARLRNSGNVTARNVSLHALIGEDNTEASTTNDQRAVIVHELLPGDEKEVVFRWENADTPGNHKVQLVANRGRSIKESNYEDNSIEFPPIHIFPVRNYSVDRFEVSPTTVSPGTNVQFSIAFFDSIPQQSVPAPIDIEFGFQNASIGATTSVREKLLRITNDEVLSRTLLLPPGFTSAFATVNSSRDAEELDLGDSTAIHPLNLVVELPEWDKDPPLDLAPYFDSSEGHNLDSITTAMLAMAAEFTSTTDKIRVSCEAVTTGAVVADAVTSDNAWLLRDGHLEALQGEDAGEVHFQFTSVFEDRNLSGSLFAWITAAHANDENWGQFEAQINKQEWTEFNFATPGPRFREVYLSDIDMSRRDLDITIRHTTASSVHLESFVVRPHVAVLTTPIFRLPDTLKNKPLLLSSSGHALTQENAIIETRTAVWRETTGSFDFSPWHQAYATSTDISVGSGYFQARIFMKRLHGELPILTNLELRPQ